MKKLYRIIVLAILLPACVDESVQRADSGYKAEVIRYLTQEAPPGDAPLADRVDFTRMHAYPLRTNESVLIAPLRPLAGIAHENQRVTFFLNEGEIVRSNITAFSAPIAGADYDQLVVDILNMEPKKPAYTGDVTIYNIHTKLTRSASFDRGKLIKHGTVMPANDARRSGRTQGCIDWYLITTWYFAWGTTSNETYIYTTCSCEEETFRTSQSACGGGSSGSGTSGIGGPNFPQNPANNAEYEYTGPDGKHTLYRYSETTRVWTIVMMVLPPAVVIAEQAERPFLNYRDPVDGEQVIGSDDFLYQYDAASGNWTGTLIVFQRAPIKEFEDKCEGLSHMWTSYPRNEAYGLITADGKLLFVAITNYLRGEVPAPSKYGATTYYAFISDTPPVLQYDGMLTRSENRYYIPVVATVHTHPACTGDGTAGFDYLSEQDASLAKKHPELNHWVIGCSAIGQFSTKYSYFFNIQHGALTTTCHKIH